MKTKQLYGVLALLILFSMLTGGCTKTSIDKDVTQNQSSFSVSEAKDWLAKASNSNLTGRTTDRTTIINPDWEHTVAKEDERYQAIEIPVTFTSRFFLASSAENAAFSSKNVTKYLVLKDKKTGELSSVLMNVVSDKVITDRDFHYAEVPADFSGQVFYSTAEAAALINGWKYTNGKITGTITAGKHIEAAQPNCQDIEMGVYSTTCYYSGGGSLQYCDAAVLIYTYTISTCTGTGGGGTGSGPGAGVPDSLNSVTTVTNNLTDSCLKSIVNNITNLKIKNLTVQMFNSMFSGNHAPNDIVFQENHNLLDIFGQPAAATSSVNPVTHAWTVQINPEYGSSVSVELWGSIVTHELMHAFITILMSNNPNLNEPGTQHTTIFYNLVNQSSEFLQDVYGLSVYDANALSLGGLDQVIKDNNYAFRPEFNSFAIANYGISLQSAEDLRRLYKNGTKGTHCN